MMTIVAEEDRQRSGFSPEVRLNPASALVPRHLGPPISRPQRGAHESPPYLRAKPQAFDLREPAFTRRLPYPQRSGLRFRETIALGLLTIGAVFSVGYGLLCGMGFVSHWDLFQSGIQRVLQ